MISNIIDFLLGLPRKGKEGQEEQLSMEEEMKKYKLNLNHLEQEGGIKKLERDGFSRHDIHTVLHREMYGAPADKHREVISKLYDRSK
jgi:hypothetical protein